MLGAIVLVGGLILLGGEPEPGAPGELEPVESITHQERGNHLHGLGYDEETDRLYLATHYGLFLLEDAMSSDPSLYQVGETRDDLMGFTLHPTNGSTMWASGHPATGGNLGVIQSTQHGFNWTHISDADPRGPVDFHSMTVSSKDPRVLAGAHAGQLYVSQDGGHEWFITGDAPQGACFGAPCLHLDPNEPERLYAGTLQGLLVSNDLGQNWNTLHDAQTAAIAQSPADGTLYAFLAGIGLAVSTDAGDTWTPSNEGLELSDREVVFTIDPHREDPNILFLATTADQVYRSTDGADSWERILP